MNSLRRPGFSLQSAFALLLLGLVVLLPACASPYAKDRSLVRAKVAPAEIAILEVEDRSPGRWAPTDVFRSALVGAALNAGFTPLSRNFVDQAEIDPDVPALGDAGVLHLRILSWVDGGGEASSLHVRYHLTLHHKGELLSDLLETSVLTPDATLKSLDADARMERMAAELAKQMMAEMPPPPAL
jgi:hypothetical protein